MPRPKEQSELHAPLNEVLGTEATVRLLRVLALATMPLGAGELSRRAQLGRTGVYPALARLESVGIIEFVGAGPTRQVRLRSAHPLAPPLVALFQAEAQRVELLVTELRGIFASFARPVTSAWLRESQNRTTTPGGPDAMTCYIVSDPRSLHHLVDLVEDQLSGIERTFQVHIEVVPLSRSEVSSRIRAELLDDVILLAGVPPKGLLEHETKPSFRHQTTHGIRDVRARLLADAVAAKLRRDPSLVERIRANLDARMHKASPQERRELKEWLRIISAMSPSKFRRFLVDDSERAVRLRQSIPAFGLLTSAEREAILAGEAEHESPQATARNQ